MESVEEKVRFVVYTKVEGVKSGFIHFEGSRESIYLGEDCGFKVGDNAKITFERVDDVKPTPPPK